MPCLFVFKVLFPEDRRKGLFLFAFSPSKAFSLSKFILGGIVVKNRISWKLKDIIMVAVLGLVFAAVYMAVFHLGLAIQALLTPFGLGDIAFEFVYGIWFMAATLAAYIIRKPTVAFAAEVLASVMELFMGNAGGIRVVITGIVQGLGSEAGFAIFRYKKFDLVSMCVSGMTTAVLILLWICGIRIAFAIAFYTYRFDTLVSMLF